MSVAGAPARTGLGLLAIACANLLAGASYAGQALAIEGLPAGCVGALRNLVAVVPLAVWVRWRGAGTLAWGRRDIARVAFLGTVAYGLPMLLGIVGVALASSSNGSILVLLEPATILVFAWLVLGEPVVAPRLVGVGLGLVGALCIVLEGASPGELAPGDAFAGNAILALHGVLWGLYTPLVKPLAARREPLAISLYTLAFSLVLLVPYAAFELTRWTPDAHLLAGIGWSVALGLGVSLGATVLWVIALRHLPAGTTAAFVFLQPLAGVAVGTLVLGERLSTATVVGGAAILGGCYLATRRR